MLKLEHVKTGYGSMPVVHDASFHVKAGTIMALLGSNGSGKTSLLRAIFGTLPIMAGAIEYKGQSIVGTKSYRMVEMGISMVPEGRHLFGKMSVRDNLVMGAYSVRDKEEIERRLQSVFQMFPRVEERQRPGADVQPGAPHPGRTLSGPDAQIGIRNFLLHHQDQGIGRNGHYCGAECFRDPGNVRLRVRHAERRDSA